MGGNNECWFQFEDGCVDGPRHKGAGREMGGKRHPIAKDDASGRAFRRKLVEVTLTDEDMGTIPKYLHRMLPFLRRKVGFKTGREVEEEDYKGCMLLLPIDVGTWAELWGSAKAGKRGGEALVYTQH